MNGNAHASHFANQGYSNVSQNGNMGARGEKPKEARYVHPEEDETGHYQVRIGMHFPCHVLITILHLFNVLFERTHSIVLQVQRLTRASLFLRDDIGL